MLVTKFQALAIGALLWAAASCDGPVSPVEQVITDSVRVVTREVPGVPGMIQRVTLRPGRPHPGDTLSINSVLVQRERDSSVITARICGLDLDGTLEIGDVPGLATCAGYSIGPLVLLAVDSLSSGTLGIVRSPPGTYMLTVRHLLEPAYAIPLDVEVRAR